jgi:hypothetical protein
MNNLYVNRNCGFFSDFLTILAGIMYFHDTNEKFHINWVNSLYSDDINENLYSKFFNQVYEIDSIQNEYLNVTPYGYYFPEAIGSGLNESKIYENLKKPSHILKHLNITNNQVFNEINTDYFNGLKVLGVQRRGTDHGVHGEILSDVFFLNEINEEFRKNSYDKVFVITDDINSLNFLKNELGDSLLYNDITRNNTKSGLHFLNLPNKSKLPYEVILDSVLLSLTDYKLITRSNVSTFSLLYNLNENFKYLDSHIRYS